MIWSLVSLTDGGPWFLRMDRSQALARLTVGVWAVFFATLALYQLPQTRISAGVGRVPYFVVPALLAVVLTLREARRADLVRFRVEFGVLGLLIVATLLTGAVNHHGWIEAVKRIGYLALGLTVLVAVYRRPAILRPLLIAFVFTAAAMAVFGFYLLLTGYGEAAALLYWGLHYTGSTRNGDAYFMLLPFFLSLYLAVQPGPRWLRLTFVMAAAVMWLALLYSFSRGTWIAVGLGFLVLVLIRRNLKTAVVVGVALIISGLILLIPIRDHNPILEFFTRAGSVTSTSDATSNRERLALLGAGVSIIISHPIAGVGVEGLDQIPFGGESHNVIGTLEDTYLTAWAEYGFLGLVVAMLVVLLPIARCLQARIDPSMYVLTAGSLAFAANSLTVSVLSSAWFWIIPMTLVAVVATAPQLRFQHSSARRTSWQAHEV
jgi:O-antigen ligase